MFTIVLLFNLITFLQAGCPPDHFPQQQSIYDVYFDACQGWNSNKWWGLSSEIFEELQTPPELTFSRQVVFYKKQTFILNILILNLIGCFQAIFSKNYVNKAFFIDFLRNYRHNKEYYICNTYFYKIKNVNKL